METPVTPVTVDSSTQYTVGMNTFARVSQTFVFKEVMRSSLTF